MSGWRAVVNEQRVSLSAAEHAAHAGLSPGLEPIHIRRDFNALAVFAPSVPTDMNGRAEVKVKLPTISRAIE